MTSLELCSQLKDFAQSTLQHTLRLSLNDEYLKKAHLIY